jgi:hypothetical protein
MSRPKSSAVLHPWVMQVLLSTHLRLRYHSPRPNLCLCRIPTLHRLRLSVLGSLAIVYLSSSALLQSWRIGCIGGVTHVFSARTALAAACISELASTPSCSHCRNLSSSSTRYSFRRARDRLWLSRTRSRWALALVGFEGYCYMIVSVADADKLAVYASRVCSDVASVEAGLTYRSRRRGSISTHRVIEKGYQ